MGWTYGQRVRKRHADGGFTGLRAFDVDLSVNGFVANRAYRGGIEVSGGTATLRDIFVRGNGVGIQTHGVRVDVDRVVAAYNLGSGLVLGTGTSGRVFNLLGVVNKGHGVDCFESDGRVTLVNATIAYNELEQVSCQTPSRTLRDEPMRVFNSIVWQDRSGDVVKGPCGFSYSLVKGGDPGVGNLPANTASPGFVQSGAAPYSLKAGSACVDAGADGITNITLPAMDLLGNPRKRDKWAGGRIIDMGAYEVQ